MHKRKNRRRENWALTTSRADRAELLQQERAERREHYRALASLRKRTTPNQTEHATEINE